MSKTFHNYSGYLIMTIQENIKKAYTEYVLENGKAPASPFVLTKTHGIAEDTFYQEYNSMDAVEADIWLGYFTAALDKVQQQEVYEQYSVREKLLSFYYIWVEVLKKNRSFVLFTVAQSRTLGQQLPQNLYSFKQDFKEYIGELVREGRTTGEIVSRPLVMERYADGLWRQALFILNFWVKDPSKNYEQTDAAIEKAVNTSFDLLGRTVFDSVFDFAKFLYQNRS
jgi:hypothetical protein